METQPASSPAITSDVPTTKPKIKSLGRVAAGKRLAEKNKQAREAKKQQASSPKSKVSDTPKEEKSNSNNSFYYILGFGTLIVSGLGVFYQREAILNTMRRNRQQIPTPEPEPEPEPKKKRLHSAHGIKYI